MAQPTWPARRGSYDEFAQRYGAERADRYARAFFETDRVADALFAPDTPLRGAMRSLRTALASEEIPADTPEPVVALVEDMRHAFDDVDAERLERGRQVYLSIPAFTHLTALGSGSLVHTYSSPAISTVLANTGRLVEGARRRLADTRNWTYHLYLQGDMRPGGGAFEHTGLVRAMHAYSRAEQRKAGYDESQWGAPICDIDMVRTWLDFTYVPYRGMQAFGWTLTEQQTRDIYYLWQIVGRMLGIPADLLEGLDDHESARETAEAIDSVAGEPDENSRALVSALVDATAEELATFLGVPKQAMVDQGHAEIRMIHGDELADSLGIPPTLLQVAMTLNAPVVSSRYDLLRRDEQALAQEVATNEAQHRQLLQLSEDGQSAYETAPTAA